ncbi:hypothetical protein KGO06_02230 [Patescibacteria group bacterium]|nr:hypothetical protein [Patescibacteria group bacterium]
MRLLRIALLTAGISAAHAAFAATDITTRPENFVPIAPIMGESGQYITSGSLGQYINTLFRYSIGVGATLAIIWIMIGGFEYIFSEATESKQTGRRRITNAIYGLLILLFVSIILYTIDPLSLNLDPFRTGS